VSNGFGFNAGVGLFAFVWFLVSIAFLVLLVLLVVLAIRWLLRSLSSSSAASPSSPGASGTATTDTALAVLRERFARGEIDAEEFEQRRRTLGG
jgi:putative membrane protein